MRRLDWLRTRAFKPFRTGDRRERDRLREERRRAEARAAIERDRHFEMKADAERGGD